MHKKLLAAEEYHTSTTCGDKKIDEGEGVK